MAEQYTIKRVILNLLDQEARPFSIDEIYEYFETKGYPSPRSSIRGRLNSLAEEGRIARLARGVYAANESTLEFTQSHYSLIMSAKAGEWESSPQEIARSRFLEYTDEAIAERFRSLDARALRELREIPCLFAYEAPVGASARVGWLRDIHVFPNRLQIWFALDQDIPAIQPDQLVKHQNNLGISASEQHRTHWAIKKVDLISELSLAGILEFSEPDTEMPPAEPPAGPGPQFRPVDGKLTEVASLPLEEEVARQDGLHRLLRRDAAQLVASFQRAANRYPELARVVEEYSSLVEEELATANVTAIWSVGSALASFAQSYREQNVGGTIAEPLEPQLDALLQHVVRQHGAFIMGFKEGRELVQRSDEFALDNVRLREIREPGAPLLDELADNSDLIEDRTRAHNRAVRDNLLEVDWTVSRTAYSAYLLIRNSFRAIIKSSVGDNPNVGTMLGLVIGVSTLAGDPNAEFLRAAIPVLQHQGVQLLAFFNHSPEMRGYVEWALNLLEKDRHR
ncbi:hypothetical protein PMI42_03655 [Bradyrhizobium sp. YR681]|uniref:hypothetical protein n=1 Tax=Bradyrhizobium sp. YR681 TaxID=1144344 RepID=UPI0002710CF1|nr:hypothetical protein [Bradyrhizobium sp. YR681]EJN13039.1 hypothetical protein PMI42_03655 [Bradyrhizobium sp. YR681]